jgi:uncharacterized membrane protein
MVFLNSASSNSLVDMISRNKFPILTVAAIVLLILTANVFALNQVDYELQIFDDGSASWTIRLTVTINDTYDDLNQFQDKVQSLVEVASNATGRSMSAEAISLNSIISGSYVSLQYIFRWHNFSKIENGRILIGDVFQVQNLFPRLYGDGTILMTYPKEYGVNSIVPAPSQRDDSIQRLEWLGTAEFDVGNVDIIFTEGESPAPLNLLGQNIVLIGGLTAIVVGFVASMLVLRRRKTEETKSVERSLPSISAGIESDEAKIVKMLKSAGGSTYQTAIADYFRFSRSKTSQLLRAMEINGIVQRHKKGRDKIVTLIEKNEEKEY